VGGGGRRIVNASVECFVMMIDSIDLAIMSVCELQAYSSGEGRQTETVI